MPREYPFPLSIQRLNAYTAKQGMSRGVSLVFGKFLLKAS
jgi:hypothetical protein